jgi:hypothetical protein
VILVRAARIENGDEKLLKLLLNGYREMELICGQAD